MQPLVSVLICSHNAERFIKSTIQSVLGQTYQNIELFVLDNASIDNTVNILERIKKADSRLHVFAGKKNIGAYPGLNYLLDKANGSYIAINDHDDIWHHQKLEKQIQLLETHEEYIGCGTAIINWYEKYQRGVIRMQPKEYSIAWHTSLVYRNEGFRYDTTQTIGTDFFFMQNVLCKNGKKIFNLPCLYVFRRLWKGDGNLSSTWMGHVTIKEIIHLKIPLMDKGALLNRKFFPSSVIEWVHTHINASTITKDSLPSEFRKFIVS